MPCGASALFQQVISDADGAALQDSVHSMACFRATDQLAKLFGLKGEDVTWEKVKAVGRQMEYEKLCRTCFEPARIQCILIDDGLGGSKDLAEGYKWHDKLTTSPTKRIVRLEVSAEVFLRPVDDLIPLISTFSRTFSLIFSRPTMLTSSIIQLKRFLSCLI